jgi:methylthioribulose-1-phosphate dehydratase
MNFQESAEKLSAVGGEFYRRGWVMGTSGNFSASLSREPRRVCITASGNEKGALDESNFLTVDENGAIIRGDGKPSAETLLHLVIYRMRENSAHAFGLGNDSLGCLFRARRNRNRRLRNAERFSGRGDARALRAPSYY